MTHLPACERQPLWEGSERIRDAYSLPSQRFSLALSFPQPSPLLGRTSQLYIFHDFSRQISPLCVLCNIVEVCSFGWYMEGDGEGGKRGTGGENPEGEGGLQPGCPPSPSGFSPQDNGRTVLRIPSTQTIRKRKKQPVTEKAERQGTSGAPRASKTAKKRMVTKRPQKNSPYPLDKSQQRCYTNFINR
mgnify:CR=1 FL=1